MVDKALCFAPVASTAMNDRRALCLQAGNRCCSLQGGRKVSQKNIVHCSVKPSVLTKNLCGTKKKN